MNCKHVEFVVVHYKSVYKSSESSFCTLKVTKQLWQNVWILH